MTGRKIESNKPGKAAVAHAEQGKPPVEYQFQPRAIG